ncbi:MAG: hypothetical protein JJ879_12475 [Sneathiella sp.]|nr:hypothetical protein [Sneathiella sp.]
MTDTTPSLELLLVCTKEPIPSTDRARVQTILAMYGYTTLYQREVICQKTILAPKLDKYPHQLQIIAQNLQTNISEKYGVKFNFNILKAVKGLKRKLSNLDMYVAFPQSLADHTEQISSLGISELPEIQSLAAKNISDFHPPFPIVSTISNYNSRTRVDKVQYKGGVAVCKTFRTTNTEGLEREIASRKALGEKIPEISRVLESGENYLVMPLYKSVWEWDENSLSLFPLKYAENCIDIVRRINSERWSLLDWHPGNFIYGPDDQVTLIDLEAAKEEPVASPFTQCPDIVGHKDFPYQGKPINYVNTWQPIVGIPLNVLLDGSKLHKSLHRSFYFIVKSTPKWAAKRLEQKLRLLYRSIVRKDHIHRSNSYFIL